MASSQLTKGKSTIFDLPDLQTRNSEELVDEMVDRISLQVDINDLIEPYKDNADLIPPFPGSELVVMALICATEHDDLTAAREDILNWILQKSAYYMKLAVSTYVCAAAWPHDEDGDNAKVYNDVSGFHEAFEKFDVPVVAVETKTGYGSVSINYKVSARAARVFLRGRLEPEREGQFRFLDLPAEIRNRIYELVLQ